MVLRTQTLPALTGVRALAAGWVVAQHFREPLTTLFPGLTFARPVLDAGWLGVEVFFVLSGFVLAHNYAHRVATSPDRARFWRARVARVVPVHVVSTLLVAAAAWALAAQGVSIPGEDRYSAANVAGNLIMLQAMPGFRGVNWPSWSVSCEAVAYLLFPILALRLTRSTPRSALIGAGVLLLAAAAGPLALMSLTDEFWSLSYPVMWWRIGMEFPAGMLLWTWWSRRSRPDPRWDAAAMAAAVVVLVVAALTGYETPWSLLAAPAVGVFVLACASATGPVANVLSSRVAQWGGRISYSLYMTHFAVLLAANRLIDWDVRSGDSILTRIGMAAAVVAAMVGAAAVMYYAIEEPARTWLSRRLSRNAQQNRPAKG